MRVQALEVGPARATASMPGRTRSTTARSPVLHSAGPRRPARADWAFAAAARLRVVGAEALQHCRYYKNEVVDNAAGEGAGSRRRTEAEGRALQDDAQEQIWDRRALEPW